LISRLNLNTFSMEQTDPADKYNIMEEKQSQGA